MLTLAVSNINGDSGIAIYMDGGVVHFEAHASVTPARAKQILEDALEALNKWALEQ